jgi:membrane-associated protein
MNFLEILLHIDVYLQFVISEYSTMTYVLLFLIIFIETGIVIMPFLPGDSLLFAVGALAATGILDIWIVFVVFFVAAVLGDTANYHIGKFAGPKVFKKEDSVLFHKKHLRRAEQFYEKYGGKTIILARFIPIVRTFAPFVAGVGTMTYKKFISYNVIGAAMWCGIFTFAGYLFGNIPFVKENFGIVIIAIIVISLLPLGKGVADHYRSKKTAEKL